jgi:hypothetical protein
VNRPIGAAALVVAALLAGCGPGQSATTSSSPLPVTASHVSTSPLATVPPASPSKIVTATAGPQCHFRSENGFTLPDPKCTPGSVQSTSVAAICTPGWATAHREYFTVAEREKAFARYGVYTTDPAGYGEYDHLIPLELGGSNNADNLWPEKGAIPNFKDPIENALHDAVCSGHASLAAAQRAIAADWPTAGTKVIEVGSGLKSSAPRPAPVTSAPRPAPSASAPAPVSCHPTTSGGNCYRAGELCPAKDHGRSGVAGNGEAITCENNNGWRWESA